MDRRRAGWFGEKRAQDMSEDGNPQGPAGDLSLRLVRLTAPIVGLLGGSSAREVRIEADSSDMRLRCYWRYMMWWVAMAAFGILGIGAIGVSTALKSTWLSGLAAVCLALMVGCCLLAVVFGVRLQITRYSRFASKLDTFIRPRSVEVYAVFGVVLAVTAILFANG